MVVILMEGSDLCGKSTIAKELAKRLKIPYYKGKGPTNIQASIKDRAIAELNQITDFLEQTNHSVVIDRNYLSEWVYGSVFHREIDEAHLKEIDDKYSKMDAVNIIVTASDEVLEKRFEKRGDRMIDMAGIIMVKEKYDRVSQSIKTPVITIENNDDVEEVIDLLEEHFEELAENGHINL